MVSKMVGKRIQVRREEVGLKQEQLAEAADMSTIFISHVEQGRKTPSLDSFIKIANALKISADLLLVDVIEYGYKVKASQLGEIVEGLSPAERAKVFDVVSAMTKKQ